MFIFHKIKDTKNDMVLIIWKEEFYILQHNDTHGSYSESIFFLDWHKGNNKGFFKIRAVSFE